MKIDFDKIETPCYIIDEELIENNLKILADVQKKSGAKILLATKAFSNYATFPLIGKYLCGVTSSSLHEARLGYEEMGKEVHIFSPAYKDSEFDEITALCDHIVFNSYNQWQKYKSRLNGKECGIRVNPEYSEAEKEIYDPCARFSRLGVTLSDFEKYDFSGIDGLHFHTMCEQNSDTLKRTLEVFESKFGKYIKRLELKWINFGGGHHITRADYDIETLLECIKHIKDTYGTEVYIEPGEAVALNAGFLVSEVLDIVHNGMDICILDSSAACHMPDVIEMPYRPPVEGDTENGAFKYRFAGPTCLAGDIIGDYSFDKELKIGDKVVFRDMAIYTTVKNNTFNGIRLPNIYYNTKEGIRLLKKFGYEDFKSRL